jgi:hypothetical protein
VSSGFRMTDALDAALRHAFVDRREHF